ncbi:MAG: prolyl oligopeptidase family serine peptidase, partial [Planctomycetota bacterium]
MSSHSHVHPRFGRVRFLRAGQPRDHRWLAGLLSLVTLAVMLPSAAAPPTYKELPPRGNALTDAARDHLQESRQALRRRWISASQNDPRLLVCRADVEVLLRAVQLAVEQDLFYKPRDVEAAEKVLNEVGRRISWATKHAAQLDRPTARFELLGWQRSKSNAPQPLLAGFVSRIDDSVQPMGIVVPAGFTPDDGRARRLDVWLHGRGDTKAEVPFAVERMSKLGQYTPEDTIVLHPFGRHCNAYKFAGETDVFEAIEAVRARTTIDPRLVSIRGFSMGGAGCWHLAVHHPGSWFAANPGAGFVDTLVYQGWKRPDQIPFPMTAAQRKLMNWYDVLPWSGNVVNTRLIAYSGELDKQKQAADRMQERCERLGITWPHVIGKEMGHKINAESAATIQREMAQWQREAGEEQGPSREVDFTTYTLRYPGVDWIEITGIKQHWKRSRIRGSLNERTIPDVIIRTDSVTRFRLDFRGSQWPGKSDFDQVPVIVDGQVIEVPLTDGVLQCEFQRQKDWQLIHDTDDSPQALRKHPGLQGPIDDAFTDRFLFVLPSRPARHGQVERWIQREIRFAQDRWKEIMRGDVRTVLDTELTEEHILNNHLVCFGDLQSNRYLARITQSLPVRWNEQHISIASQQTPSTNHALALCYPNPL